MRARRTILLCLLIVACAGVGVSQDAKRSDAYQLDNLAGLFPEIPGCVKIVKPASRTENFVEMTIAYVRQGYETRIDDPNYFVCGSITLRKAPGIGKSREPDVFQFPTPQKSDIRGYEAWRHSPLCGNDPWLGSIEVLLSDDQVMELSAAVGADAIMEFVDDADLALISDRIRIWLK